MLRTFVENRRSAPKTIRRLSITPKPLDLCPTLSTPETFQINVSPLSGKVGEAVCPGPRVRNLGPPAHLLDMCAVTGGRVRVWSGWIDPRTPSGRVYGDLGLGVPGGGEEDTVPSDGGLS